MKRPLILMAALGAVILTSIAPALAGPRWNNGGFYNPNFRCAPVYRCGGYRYEGQRSFRDFGRFEGRSFNQDFGYGHCHSRRWY